MSRLLRTSLAVSAASVAVVGAFGIASLPAAAESGAVARVASSAVAVSHPLSGHGLRALVAKRWERAWNHDDAAAMAALFVKEGVYTDRAFQASFTGRQQIAGWVKISSSSIAGLQVDVHSVFGEGRQIAVLSTFSGQLRGAPKPFSVPVVTTFVLDGHRVKSITDTYNLAAVLQQSGLPADFQPGQPSAAK